MLSTRSLSLVAGASLAAALTGCVVAPPPQRQVVYQQPAPIPAPVPVYAEYGRVERIGTIAVAARPTGAGVILGAVIGGVVGNRFGGGMGRALATGAGAVGGAVVGNAIEGQTAVAASGEVYRVTVRFDNGAMRDFDFHRIDDLRTGDRVKLEGGQIHRL